MVAAHPYFETYVDAAGKYRWSFNASNYRTLTWTTKGYDKQTTMLTNLVSFRNNALNQQLAEGRAWRK
jgi:uncharacterized protein YegP (UPF0339 family)